MEQLIKKAWKISAKDLEEPWHYDDITVMADTRGEARSKGLNELTYQCAKKIAGYLEDDELYYVDIIATREKESDNILYEGKEIKRRNLKNYLWQKERDENARLLTISNPNDLAVVYAGCYSQYWGANHSGYSSSIFFAGKYTTKEAYEIVKGSAYSRQEEVRLLDVEQFNRDIELDIERKQKEIDRLKTYKING
jgi:hypothetical protein